MTGAVGLLSTGNWHLCQKAVQTVLAGGNPRQVFTGIITPPYFDDSFECGGAWDIPNQFPHKYGSDQIEATEWISSERRWNTSSSFGSETELSDVTLCLDSGMGYTDGVKGEEPKLLNLFV